MMRVTPVLTALYARASTIAAGREPVTTAPAFASLVSPAQTAPF